MRSNYNELSGPAQESALDEHRLQVMVGETSLTLSSLNELKENRDRELQKIENELAELQYPFMYFFAYIKKHKPDKIILLDKGARAFYHGMEMAIQKLGIDTTPEVILFNDQKLKRLHSKSLTGDAEDYKSLAIQDFGIFLGQSIIFVDETISEGTGAAALLAAAEFAHVDAVYYALTQHPDLMAKLQKQKKGESQALSVESMVARYIDEHKIELGSLKKRIVFSQDFSKHLVREDNEGKLKDVDPRDDFKTMVFPQDISKDRYIEKVAKIESNFVDAVDQKIVSAMQTAAELTLQRVEE